MHQDVWGGNKNAKNVPGVVAAESVPEAIGLADPLGVIGVKLFWAITFWRTSLIFNCRLDLFGKISTWAAWESN
jgi:hypothetical protein